MRIYTKQLKNKNVISVKKGNGLYEAVVSDAGKYTKVVHIAARVQKHMPACH